MQQQSIAACTRFEAQYEQALSPPPKKKNEISKIVLSIQCDQIGLHLNDLGNIYSYKSSPNIDQLLRSYEKYHF